MRSYVSESVVLYRSMAALLSYTVVVLAIAVSMLGFAIAGTVVDVRDIGIAAAASTAGIALALAGGALYRERFLRSTRVFLSYSSENRPVAAYLLQGLSERGYEVFDHATMIPAGVNWREEILSALSSADYVVAVLTPASVQSPAVQLEIDHALARGTRIIPIVYPGTELPARISLLTFIPFGDELEDERLILDKVVESIEFLRR